MNRSSHKSDPHALEARLASRLAGLLTARTEAVPHDIAERLRVARDQAVAHARGARLATPAATGLIGITASGAGVLGGFIPWWQKAASVLPLLALVAGLVAIDLMAAREQVMVAAEIDAQLLSDTLPPAAYSDPGFVEFLRAGPSP